MKKSGEIYLNTLETLKKQNQCFINIYLSEDVGDFVRAIAFDYDNDEIVSVNLENYIKNNILRDKII